jgi:hypothetical protein
VAVEHIGAAQRDIVGLPSKARLSLVTFFAKTKKVTGRAALKRAVAGRQGRLALKVDAPPLGIISTQRQQIFGESF